MKLHPHELDLARAYAARRHFEPLSADQLHRIMERGRELYKWFKSHPGTHNLINAIVVASLFGADGWALLGLPRVLLGTGERTWGSIILASLVTGACHSWLVYSMTVLSLHEGAAHDIVFVGKGAIARAGRFVARNMCRVGASEPDQYADCHMQHHAKFGTEHDSEFLNFVMPRRYWLTFLPFAAFVNFTDFLAHRPLSYTRKRLVSAAVALTYNGAYGLMMYQSYGAALPLLVLFGGLPHLGFFLDRLRQFTEHNLMPLDNRSGARSFGIGFWGWLVGGGPWGQPCHFLHHLYASIPWYQQIALHHHMKRLLTSTQREQFLIAPIVGFPKLLWAIVHEANTFAHAQVASTATRGPSIEGDNRHDEAVER